jgi:arogenate dehydrogenase (NADP+), plant
LILAVKSSSSFTNNNKTLSKSSNITKGHMTEGSNESQESKRLIKAQAGKIEQLKQKEAALARLLASVRMEKLDALRSRPLKIGIIGFGRFGQFIARTFAKHGSVVATSRSDYTDLASGMGITYIPLSNPQEFLEEELDVIVLATSIVSFEHTVADLVPHLQAHIQKSGTGRGPLIVDVLSVKEHPRQILLDQLPKECDILCTHPMFGPDSGKNGWHGLNFVYEITRIDGVVLEQDGQKVSSERDESFVEEGGRVHSVHELSESHIEGKDRIERFLSIWEEEGCKMVPLSCKAHDAYAADSQFITHLMGRILGAQGLAPTPIDTKGFDSVLKLIDSTTADSFDLFYGLYKYNQNSMDTIIKLRDSMDDVVKKLKEMERNDK